MFDQVLQVLEAVLHDEGEGDWSPTLRHQASLHIPDTIDPAVSVTVPIGNRTCIVCSEEIRQCISSRVAAISCVSHALLGMSGQLVDISYLRLVSPQLLDESVVPLSMEGLQRYNQQQVFAAIPAHRALSAPNPPAKLYSSTLMLQTLPHGLLRATPFLSHARCGRNKRRKNACRWLQEAQEAERAELQRQMRVVQEQQRQLEQQRQAQQAQVVHSEDLIRATSKACPSGTTAAVLPFVLMTVAAHRVRHAALVGLAQTVMLIGVVYLAMPEIGLMT
ncbi:TPA: hypothetical protein ACH3X1_013907 [Trebouxia sp. C0004]